MMTPRKISLLASASISALTLGNANVIAQDQDDAPRIEEIIVSATKRNESVQDVPLAITAFDGETTKRMNLDNVKDLIKFAPGIAGNSQDSFLDYINVRGISTNDFGNGGDPSIGLFKNGLYQGRTGSAVTSLYDIARAEVLRGPQGFLFGRNAVSGAISFHTERPNFDSNDGYVDVDMGERGLFNAEAAINVPVSENFALRFAGVRNHEDGYIHNIARPQDDPLYGVDTWAGRMSAAVKGETWDAFFMLEHEDRNQSGTVYWAQDDRSTAGEGGAWASGISVLDWLSEVSGGVNVRLPADPRTLNSDASLGNYDRAEITSFSAEINKDFDWGTLTSVTGYKDHKYAYAEDYDGMPINYNDYSQAQSGDYFEQELRAVSNDDGPLKWYAGVSYFKEKIDTEYIQRMNEDLLCTSYYGTASYYAQYYYPGYYTGAFQTCEDLYTYWGYTGADVPVSTSAGLIEGNRTIGNFSGWAAYIDLTYALNDKLDMSVGVRYVKNKKRYRLNVYDVDSDLGHWYIFAAGTGNQYIQDRRSWDDFTPRFMLRYKPSDDFMIYGSVTKGFKSGGYNSFGFLYDDVDDDGNGINARPQSYEPEEVWSYEMGIKGTSANGRVKYDLSAYHYKYTDLQLNYWDSGTIVDNIGKVKSWGLEGSVNAILSDNFDLILSGSYNDNSIRDANDIEPGSDGNRLPGAPKYKASGLLSYHTPMGDSGEMFATFDWTTSSSYFSSGLANLELGRLNGYTDANFKIGYRSDNGWALTGYVDNIGNSVYYDGGVEIGFPVPSIKFGVSRPRTFGAKLSVKFGQ